MWLGEQFLSTQPWWPQLHWGTITGAFVLFSLGFYWRDSFSHHPWFNLMLNRESIGFSTTASFVDFVKSETQWFVPTLHLKFWQDTEAGWILIRVFDDTDESFVSFEKKSIPHRKGDVSKIPLCWIRNPTAADSVGYHSVWGETPGKPELTFGERTVVSGKKYWIRVSYEWGENSRASDTFFLQVQSRPEQSGGGVSVLFGLVSDFVPDALT
jgi:hypothetical protein